MKKIDEKDYIENPKKRREFFKKVIGEASMRNKDFVIIMYGVLLAVVIAINEVVKLVIN